MIRMRRIASAFWLALALAIGQQAAALHALGHATEQLSRKHDSAPAPSSCDLCFACAELSGAVAATVPTVPAVVAGHCRSFVVLEPGAPAAARLAFRSRAPPTLL